jgi:2-C-methyl-D-erythritol 4-phosphate cytidylyltransferase
VRDSAAVDELVVVAPASHVPAVLPEPALTVVAGGPTRQASVRRGLAALSESVDVVLVHDAARCLAPPSLVAAVAAAVRDGAVAVVPGVPVADTIRSLDGQRVDRSRLRAVQTPQGFARTVLERAHALAAGSADDETLAATDDAGLVEALGEPVLVVPGAPEAFKITTPLDLLLAAAVLGRT